VDADDVELDLPVVVMEPSGRRATVKLDGEVDAAVEQYVVEAVRRTARLEGLAAIDVDATAVTFIDSSGLRALILGRDETHSHGLQYTVHTTAGSFVARVFAIAGLDDALDIHIHGRMADEGGDGRQVAQPTEAEDGPAVQSPVVPGTPKP